MAIASKTLQNLKRKIMTSGPTSRIVLVLLVIAAAIYAGYMSEKPQNVNPASYQQLLQLIGRAESNDNYNAYFSNAANSSIRFTEMSIADVLSWQNEFLKNGNPSSAVGRYQIINTTLQGLVGELQLDVNQKFNESTQDKLAIALLERRGSAHYANGKLTAQELAANLAKEWAALPKTIGENPSASYYAGDGLNASRVAVDEVLRAIEPIHTF